MMAWAGPVGIVGLGAMGRPLADHLLAADHEVAGFDVSAAAREAHARAGGRVVRSVGELRGLDTVLTSLPSAAALNDVVAALGDPGRARPLVVVETSTLTLAEKEAARDRCRAQGLVLVDCPLSGTSAQARMRDLVAYVSADDQAALDHARAIIADATRATYDVGGFGNGTRMKLVANTLVAVHNLAAAEALLLAERSGLDLGATLIAVADGAGGSRMLEVRGPLMVSASYEPATARVEIFLKDLRAIRALAEGVGAPLPLLETTAAYYDEAAAQGRSEQDTACVFEVLREQPYNRTRTA